MHTWLKLRTAVYLASGFLTPGDLNDEGIYLDQYDAYSEHVLAVDDAGLTVGSARLILRQDGNPLQVEREFDVLVEAASAEISGLAVIATRRGSEVTAGLVRAVLEVARERKIDRVYAEIEDEFLRRLNRFGFPLVPMTEERFVFNTFNRVATASVCNFYAELEQLRNQRGPKRSIDRAFERQWFWYEGPAVMSSPDADQVTRV